MVGNRFQSLRTKIAAGVLASTAAALLVAGVAMVAYDLRTYHLASVDDVITQAEILGRASTPALSFDDAAAARQDLALMKTRPRFTSAALYTTKGKLFASYSADPNAAAPFPALPGADGYEVNGREVSVFRRIVENKEIVGTVYVRARYELYERLVNYLAILAVVMLASVGVAWMLSSWLQSMVTRPILAVSDVARHVMDRRDFSLRAVRTSSDEIGHLVDAFNAMLEEVERRQVALASSEGDLRRLNAELEQRVGEATAQLREVNKDLEAFSYSVLHDLRTPLTAIIGLVQLIGSGLAGSVDEKARSKLAVVERRALQMVGLIEGLLAFSRLGAASIHLADVNMGEMVAEVFEVQRGAYADLDIAFQPGSLPHAWGDDVLLRQVWTNLLSNAIKFSSKSAAPVVEVGALTSGTEQIYFVRDNGVGFDGDSKPKLFGVFQRLHGNDFPGSGIGLALSARIIERHGGRVWADSKPGEGATFHFTLPRAPGNKA